jgi:hypothetical protein
VGLRPLAYWDCGFESRRRHGCLYLVSVVCCQVEVSASGWSLVQRSPTEYGVSKVWLWRLDNEDALAHYGLLRHGAEGGKTDITNLPSNKTLRKSEKCEPRCCMREEGDMKGQDKANSHFWPCYVKAHKKKHILESFKQEPQVRWQ